MPSGLERTVAKLVGLMDDSGLTDLPTAEVPSSRVASDGSAPRSKGPQGMPGTTSDITPDAAQLIKPEDSSGPADLPEAGGVRRWAR
jgi:hypothetical protein